MKELARSSQLRARPEPTGNADSTPTPAKPSPSASPKGEERERPPNPWVTPTTPPDAPEIESIPDERIPDDRTARPAVRRFAAVAAILIAMSIVVLLLTTGRRFVEQEHPILISDESQLLALDIPMNARIETVFAVLGTVAPRAVEDQPRLQRYSFGTDLVVDAINGLVYAITIRVPNRVWRGLRVGIPETNAQGALTLLGDPRQIGDPVDMLPREVGRYRVYPSVEQRPRKTVGVEVRPPNGCFDVQVDVQPRVSGILIDGDNRYAAIGKGNVQPDWVVTQVRIVNRSMRGPFATGVAC